MVQWLWIVAIALAAPLHAAYPDKPLRLIVPFAPGGNIDVTARTLAPGLTDQLGQSVVVDNRAGAGGRIGTELAARAPADGYTLLLGSSGAMTITPAFVARIGYDPLRDFAPTSLVSIVPLVLSAHPSLSPRTMSELVALAKSRAGRLTIASAGVGSTTHLAIEMLQSVLGIRLTHVPYKGSGPGLVDAVGGQVDLIFDQVSTSGTLIRSGKLRALAVAAPARSALLPEVPTMDEAGARGFEASTYTGIMLPAGTPRDILAKVHAALLKVLDLPATRETFTSLGAEVLKSTPEEFTRRIRADLSKWHKIAKETGIKLD